MSFSDATLKHCWALAQGRCECQREGHGHEGRCPATLQESAHGLIGEGGWFVAAWTHLDQGGPDQVENCEVLCWRCYGRRMPEAA